uniref:Uncharacterized protein n=1 Tax=Octopus bimaculoides TaxID=37653 RepID=A0A0L8GW40_OCTBM
MYKKYLQVLTSPSKNTKTDIDRNFKMLLLSSTSETSHSVTSRCNEAEKRKFMFLNN